MDLKDRLEREAARGQEAKEVLGNRLFVEAWTTVESGIIQKWRDCPIKELDSQHELKLMLHVMSEVRRYIEIAAETGKLAQIQLSTDSKVKKFARSVGL